MSRVFWICLGGAAGTAARYYLQGWLGAALGPAFPYGTLAVNLIGSFFISAFMHVGLTTGLLSPTLRLALTVGVLGGFTTYSSFCYESLVLFREGSGGVGSLYVALTVAGCLAACFLGLAAAKLLAGH